MRARMMSNLMDRIQDTLADHARSRFKFIRAQFDTALEVASDNAVGDVDGMQPLAAYRRLLQLCMDHRLRSYELGSDYPEGSGCGGFAWLQRWAAAVRRLPPHIMLQVQRCGNTFKST